MTRRPLRPLARIIAARANGENPDSAEAEARLARARRKRARDVQRAQIRLLMISAAFFAGFTAIGGRMVVLATAQEPEQVVQTDPNPILPNRADITDRHGRLLATNIVAKSLYAQPGQMIDRNAAAEGLARIFPDLDAAVLKRRFAPPAKFVWVRRKVSPEQAQAVHDLGEPGLLLGNRETRLYPNGKLASHVLGGAGFGREGVHAAEVVGRAGVERWFDDRLRGGDTKNAPLELSIDLTAQTTIRAVLGRGIKLMNAKGGSAILMDAKTGEIISLVSLPDFDPNHLPAAPRTGDPGDSPLFNRAAQGVYELGSTFKLFTAAIALSKGQATPDTLIDTKPLTWGRFRIREFNDLNYGPFQSLTNVLVKSSNTGAARIAMEFGAEEQKAWLKRLGFLTASPLELDAARVTKPLYPKKWSEISTITISYGHGLSATAVHLATAYASLLNGGIRVEPSLVKGGHGTVGARIVTPEVSRSLRWMLRKVVTDGSAKLANVPGYQVAGKTGTAVKPKHTGGYYDDKVIANFAAVFPASAPKYVLVVTLDEPQDMVAGKPKRAAGWTAAPIAGEIIRRTAPILNLRPIKDTPSQEQARIIEAAQ